MDKNVYTGSLEYKEIEFFFVFDEHELRLIPPEDKVFEIEHEWYMHKIREGVYASGIGDYPHMEEPFISGRCNENGNKIVFITKKGAGIGKRNSVLFVDVIAYILLNIGDVAINRISFSSPEINGIYSIGQAFSVKYGGEENGDGCYSIQTADFDSVTAEAEQFIFESNSIDVIFGTSRTISYGVTETPLTIRSSMRFSFEPTKDYSFIFRLCKIAESFIQFLCYRNNVPFTKISLASPYKGDTHISCGELLFINCDNEKSELEQLKKGKYIKQQYITGAVGKILQSVADNTIYLRHLPNSYKDGRIIDAARFVMITAAFEWEFRRIFPNGVKKKSKKQDAERITHKIIEKAIKQNSGEVKRILKYLDKNVGSDPLSAKILFVGEELKDIVDVLGEYLYRTNDEELNYSDMGNRLAEQRNDFAHGNLDKDFNGLALLDLVFLEQIIYAMQLSYYGIGKKSVKKALNDLFNMNLILSDQE